MALSGQTAVTTAGTEVQLSADQRCEIVEVKALAANTGLIFVGNTGADVVSSATGFQLQAGESVSIRIKNLNNIWIDSAVNGEGVCWIVKA